MTFDDIPAGQTRASTNYALIRTDQYFNTLDIPFTLVFESNQEATNRFPYRKEMNFTVRLSLEKPNWPLNTGTEAVSSPVVANLDGTGERLITLSRNVLHVVDFNNNSNAGFPLTLPFPATDTAVGQIAIGDVTGDDRLEIIVLTRIGHVVVVCPSGAVLYSKELDFVGMSTASPVIADLRGDGTNQIIVASMRNIYVLNGNDLSVWNNYPVVHASVGIVGQLAVGDVNNDGTKNIVFTTNAQGGASPSIHALDPITGQNISGFPVSGLTLTVMGPSLVNLDDELDLEIVYAGNLTANCPITVIKSNGEILRQTTIPARVTTEIAISDLDRDGVPLLVFGDSAGNLHVMTPNLQHIQGFPVNVGNAIDSSPVFADVTGNGKRDIIFGDNQGFIHIVDINGKHLPGYPIRLINSTLRTSPWVGMFDGGTVLYNTPNGVSSINLKNPVSHPSWARLRGSLGNTADFNDSKPVSEGNITVPMGIFALQQNFPNPFNPQTTIRFEVPKEAMVTIDIFNIRGQRVKRLINDNLSAGIHQVVWTGHDENGNTMSSGIYFYRMQSDSFVETRRMLLIK